MPKLKDLKGQRFGKLIVLEKMPSRNRKVYWLCKCDCGKELEVQAWNLISGKTKSCGYCGDHPAKLLDITGKKFGTLTVLRLLPDRDVGRQAMWECECDCGVIINVRGTSLRFGEVKSCGNAACRGLEKDITGQRFGNLVVISKSNYKNTYSNHTYWNCKCDCGNECIVMGANLRKGHTTSCGCKRCSDITGQKFGKLTAIEPTNKRNNQGVIIWECKCDCGRTHYAPVNSLNYGSILSCGCLLSKGEEIIGKLLEQNNIIYKSQKTFDTCRFNDTDALAKFDFYINNEYLIEFDGIQHYRCNNNGWDTQEHFDKRKKHDDFKNKWCKENNIPLIRIPYTKLDTLCLEDLLLETTEFRVV